ncbi:MAG: glycosyltransferase [Acidimicrobiales bacterium]
MPKVIPRLVHFVFGLRPQDEPFHFLHYVAIESCRQVVRPEEIRLHVHQLPYGLYWDLARPLVTLVRVDPVQEVERSMPEELRPYAYARHSDVIRLELLERDGGMYADIDTIFHRAVPEDLWRAEAVIGREAPVRYPDRPGPEASLTNALVMCRPGAWFVAEWKHRVIDAMDGSWSEHSCRLATRLAVQRPDRIRVEPQDRFSPFDHTRPGLRALLEEPIAPGSLGETSSVHLMAHLWWDRNRRDFVPFSAADATEEHVRTADTPLAHLARPFLPDHGLF